MQKICKVVNVGSTNSVMKKLFLALYSKGVRDDINKDTKGNLAKANSNWPSLVEKKGK